MPSAAETYLRLSLCKSASMPTAAIGALGKKALPSVMSRLRSGWQAGKALEEGVMNMSHFRPGSMGRGVTQISNPLTQGAARRVPFAPGQIAAAQGRINGGDWATQLGAGVFKHRMPLGVGAGLFGANELHTQLSAKPKAFRGGAELGATEAINMTAGQLANMGIGDRLGFLFNPSGAGDRYRQMALQQLAAALNR